jgi:hypothetical protein
MEPLNDGFKYYRMKSDSGERNTFMGRKTGKPREVCSCLLRAAESVDCFINHSYLYKGKCWLVVIHSWSTMYRYVCRGLRYCILPYTTAQLLQSLCKVLFMTALH